MRQKSSTYLQNRRKTAVLVFSRSQEEEFEHKSKNLRLEKEKFTRLFQTLSKHLDRKLAGVDVPILQYDSEKQQGETFGERIANAMQDGFSLGYEQLIVVGNDCPDIKAGEINKAIQILDSERSVVGPDLRGGVYLFGLSKKMFDRQTFIDLPWQEDILCESLKTFLETRYTLNAKRDVNYAFDLSALRFSFSGRLGEVIRALFLSLTEVKPSKTFYQLRNALTPTSNNGLRAPPVEIFN